MLDRIASSRFARGLTVITAILLALQPLLTGLAQAQVISDPTAPIEFRPGIRTSPGGAPVVDITAPSFGGLSHNRFESFNVDQNGLILNNSGLGGNSILGGAISANPNLVGRPSARTILNEVTGSGASVLGGATEVFGGRADVIVANPNGVGCFGCSFINAGKITLSSGTPIPDYMRGSVDFDVRGGAVVVSGGGLSGVAGHTPLGDIDLIGRQIAIDAPVVAQDRVRLRAGAMTYRTAGDLATPLAGAPTLTGASIVSTAAGTITAGSISMLSRDLDLGVILGGDLETGSGSIVISSLGDALLAGSKSAVDLRIDAAGNVELLGRHAVGGYLAANGDAIIVELADLSFANGVVLQALSDIFASGDIVSGADISFMARGQVVATGRVLAGGRIALDGRGIDVFDLDVGGTHISLAATEDVTIERAALAAAADVAISGRDVTLGSGTAFGAPGRLSVAARRDFTNATVLDYANLSLSIGTSFTNTGAYIRDELAINIPGSVVNAGLLQGRILASIAARSFDNSASGLLHAPALLIATDEDVINAGLLLGREQLSIAARSLENAQTGVLDSDELAIVVDGRVINAGAMRGRDRLEIVASDLANLASGLVVGESVSIAMAGGLGNLGEILSPASLAILAGGDVANDGVIATGGDLTLVSASYVAGSEAARLAGASVDLILAGAFGNAGLVVAEGELSLTADTLENKAGASILAQAAIDLALSGDAVNSGLVLSERSLAIVAQTLANETAGVVFGPELAVSLAGGGTNSGELLADGSLTFEAGGHLANEGEVRSLGQLTFRSASYAAGSPAAQLAGVVADLVVTGAFDNAGLVLGSQSLTLRSSSLTSGAGGEIAGSVADLVVAGVFDNAGLVLGSQSLALASSSLINRAGGEIAVAVADPAVAGGTLAIAVEDSFANAGVLRGRESLDILASDFVNLESGLVVGEAVRLGIARGLNNLGEILSPASLAILAGGALSNDGVIAADGDLNIVAASYVAGSESARLAGASVDLLLAGGFDNAGTVVAGEGLSLTAGAFRNARNAEIFAQASIDLTLSGDLVNAGLILSEQSVAVAAQTLANEAGGVVVGSELTISLAGGVGNSGKLLAADGLTLVAGGGIANDGEIRSLGDITLRSASYVAGSPAAQLAGIVADLVVTGAFDNAGTVLGAQSLGLSTSLLTNRAGGEIAAGVADLAVAGTTENHGLIEAGLVLAEIGGAFVNTGSLVADASAGGDIGLVVGAHLLNQGDIRASGDIVVSATSMTTGSGSYFEGEDVALALAGMLENAGVIRARGDLAISASGVVNAGQAGAQAWISGRTLDIAAGADVTIGAYSVLEGRAATRLVAQTSNVDLFNAASIEAGRFNFGQNLTLSLSGQSLHVAPGQQIMAAGDLSLMLGGDVVVLGTIASGAGLSVVSGGSISVGTDNGVHHGGALLFTLGDAHFAAAGNLHVVSSAIEVLGGATVDLGGALRLERSGGTHWAYSHQFTIYGSCCGFLHEVHREYESSEGSVFNVAGDSFVAADRVYNHTSVISAGGNLLITARVFENLSRQLQQGYHLTKVAGNAGLGYRGWHDWGVHATTPAVMYAGGTLAISASESSVNTGTQIGNQVSLIAPSITVGITDRNVFTAPPLLPDPVIDLSRHVAELPGFAAQPTPISISTDGPAYLYTGPFAAQPGDDPQGLPVSDLSNHVAGLPDLAAGSTPLAFDADGLAEGFTAAFADLPRYDPQGLPEREPSWIMREVGDNRADVVFLADPITERMLIQRALVEQTGRTMLDPRFGNPVAQQQALYEGTVSFLLDNPEISLGQTLTTEQRASVAAPMLWYVTRDIDGVRVLSPELILPEAQLAAYAYRPGGTVQAVGDLFVRGDRVTNTGALLASGSLVIEAGEFLNERRVASMQIGHQIENRAQAGGVVSAASLLIQTDRDLVNRGGALMGETGITLLAGGDIRFEAQRVANDLTSWGRDRVTTRTRSVAHFSASAGTDGDLVLAAGGAFSLIGSSLLATGDVTVTARDGMTIASVIDEFDTVTTQNRRGFLSSSRTSFGSTAYTNIASVIGAGGDIDLRTGGDIAVLASDFAAGGDILLAAGVGENARADASVSILAGTDYASSFFQQRKSGFGLFFGGGRLDFYRSSNVRDDAMDATNAPSSLIAGGDVTILAPGDLTLQGSVVGAGGYATLAAGRDLAVTPGSEADARSHFARRSGFGFGFSSGNGGASISLGLARSSLLQANDRASAVGSLIGGGEGVLLQAGRDLTIEAARITSPGDIDLLAGRDLSVLPGASAQSRTEITKQSFAGITASVSTNVVGAAQQLRAAVDTFDSGYGNATYRAIGMASGVMQAADAVRSLSNPSVSASLSIGFSQSQRSQFERATGVVPAELYAGGDLTLAAGRDLRLVAVQARAERDLALSAGGDLTIESAQATFETATRSSSSAASIGLSASVSAQGGPSVGVMLSGEMARGRSDSQGIAQVNAQLSAGERLLVSSGGDALVAGAVIRAREIDLAIGGDLTLASRQDTGRIRGSSANIGGSLTIGLTGPSSASINVGGGFERGDRAMVAEQTAIVADERLDAYVDGHTRIDGAILASVTADLTLDTNTLSFTDIENRARFNAASAQLGISLSGDLPGVNLSGELAESQTDAITRATVGQGVIRIRDEAAQTQDVAALNRDLDLSQETTRDEAAGVRFYVSDTAVREIASGFAETRANLEATRELFERGLAGISQDVLDSVEEAAKALGLTSGTVEEVAQALIEEQVAAGDLSREDADKLATINDILRDEDALIEYAACAASGRQGFNLHDLLFAPAYAQGMCTIGGVSVSPELAARNLATLAQAAIGVTGRALARANPLLAIILNPGATGGAFNQTYVDADGTRAIVRGHGASTDLEMEIVAPNGDRTVLFLTRYGNDFVLRDAGMVLPGGELLPVPLRTALDAAQGYIGAIGGGFQAQPHTGQTVSTPIHQGGPTILITPPADRQPTTMVTPVHDYTPEAMVTWVPDYRLPTVFAKVQPLGADEAVPGRVQSRINLQSGTNKVGMIHIIRRHLNPESTGSQFTVNESDLRALLASKEVVSSPIIGTLQSEAGKLYVREVDVGRAIGTDRFNGNQPTSTLSIITDWRGNIVTAFPGRN